jgi:hypothetical protein
VAPRRAVFAPEVDDLEVDASPGGLGEEALQVALGLHDAAAAREAPARGEPVDVGVDGKGRHAERLHHHHARGLVADAGKRLQQREVGGHAAAVAFQQPLREGREGARLLRREPAAPDQALDLPDREARHRLGRRCDGEERRRHLVDARVGALGREHHRDEEREGILVEQGHRRLGIQAVQQLRDALGLLAALHAVSSTLPKFLRSWM